MVQALDCNISEEVGTCSERNVSTIWKLKEILTGELGNGRDPKLYSLCRHHPDLNSNAVQLTPLPFTPVQPTLNLVLGMKLYSTARLQDN